MVEHPEPLTLQMPFRCRRLDGSAPAAPTRRGESGKRALGAPVHLGPLVTPRTVAVAPSHKAVMAFGRLADASVEQHPASIRAPVRRATDITRPDGHIHPATLTGATHLSSLPEPHLLIAESGDHAGPTPLGARLDRLGRLDQRPPDGPRPFGVEPCHHAGRRQQDVGSGVGHGNIAVEMVHTRAPDAGLRNFAHPATLYPNCCLVKDPA
jgi:hypothetical protein